ncbi:hypothetical protein KDK_21620 [Dictyobacter kobayashii]|uniref:Uncharacterized protein n=1 Tax=Dictyobacter kobayashii TaxID=2014872 RepID=A0A402AGX7_9CHLR|nr:hypothetical protein KDK_21620 [Dictyobacter kobayashii]
MRQAYYIRVLTIRQEEDPDEQQNKWQAYHVIRAVESPYDQPLRNVSILYFVMKPALFAINIIIDLSIDYILLFSRTHVMTNSSNWFCDPGCCLCSGFT